MQTKQTTQTTQATQTTQTKQTTQATQATQTTQATQATQTTQTTQATQTTQTTQTTQAKQTTQATQATQTTQTTQATQATQAKQTTQATQATPAIKILVLNGPNLNMLGIREKNIYGTATYQDLLQFINTTAQQQGLTVECFQSNHEGALIDHIQAAWGQFDGIVINPAAYTHTSIGILDALKAVNLPTVEVHLSDIFQRESFRHISYVKEACLQSYYGLGFQGYQEALLYLKKHLQLTEN